MWYLPYLTLPWQKCIKKKKKAIEILDMVLREYIELPGRKRGKTVEDSDNSITNESDSAILTSRRPKVTSFRIRSNTTKQFQMVLHMADKKIGNVIISP